MIISFKPLLRVTARHAYLGATAEAPCEFVLPADTRARLRGGRALVRTTTGALQVLYERAGDEPLVSLAGEVLRVGVRLADPELARHTQAQARGSIALFQNGAVQAAARKLTLRENVALTGTRLRVRATIEARPLALTLAPAESVPEPIVVLAAGSEEATFDLSAAPRGRYEVTAPGMGARASYFDPELAAAGCDRVAEIRIAAPFYNTPAELELAWDAREETLRYFVVLRGAGNGDLDKLQVVDSGPQPIPFQKALAPGLTPAERSTASAIGAADSELAVFRSTTPVAHSASPRRGVQLLRGTKAVVDDLPLPSAGRASADFVVHVSKPS